MSDRSICKPTRLPVGTRTKPSSIGLIDMIKSSFRLWRSLPKDHVHLVGLNPAQERAVRLFGCLAFDKSQTDNHMFWLPEWMLIQKGDNQVLHWNIPNGAIPDFHPEQSLAKVLQRPTKKGGFQHFSAFG